MLQMRWTVFLKKNHENPARGFKNHYYISESAKLNLKDISPDNELENFDHPDSNIHLDENFPPEWDKCMINNTKATESRELL